MTTPADLPDLPDLVNLRDVGGQRTAEGRTVRSGVLYRCATPAFLDEPQVRSLVEDLGIRTRVDLRADREVAEETSAALLAAERRVERLEVHAGTARWEWSLDDDRAERVARHYLGYAVESPESFVGFARLLLDAGRTPALVHCSAGKDRTGTIVAVVLGAVGVVEQDLVADYARTTAEMPRLRAQINGLPAYRTRLAALPDEAFEALPETMTLFLGLLRERFGGERAYLAAHGMSDTELDQLADVLLGC